MHDAPAIAGSAESSAEYSLRVLLIDDQAMIGEAVRRALASERHLEFHYCGNAAEAIKIAEQFKPTVILQDLVMPGVDGLTLVRQFRACATTADVPIIVLSTKEDPTIKSEAFALGANDYLIKLPDPIELIARIRLHSKGYLNQLQRDAAYLELRNSQRKLVEINIELRRLTNVDGLTGLSNRRYFDEYGEAQWRQAARERCPVAILMIDVDHFKLYNDNYGHLAGDEVLKSVAAAVERSFVRPTDLAARFGGEEFVVILPATPPDPLQSLGERLARNVEELNIPHRASAVADHVTISVGGAATTPVKGAFLVDLIKVADGALYEAKATGRNRVVTRSSDPPTPHV